MYRPYRSFLPLPSLPLLSKLGDTEFYVSQIKVTQDFNLFIPISKLNEIRREAILKLQTVLKESYPRTSRDCNYDVCEYPCLELDYSL